MQDLLEPIQETLKAPPKRWLNNWRATKGIRTFCQVCGDGLILRLPGENYTSHCFYPSKEIAEEVAARALEDWQQNYPEHVPEFLGSYPAE